MRRALDILLSGAGLIITLPMLLVLAAVIRWDSPGSPLFSQVRIGRGGEPFRLLKLRTMRSVSGGSGLTQGTGDPRITRVGQWLRRTKLDELPQLWNVLVGDMSLVGPRPEVPQFVAHYTEAQREVLRARPGLTDPASLHGFDEGAVLSQVEDPDRHYVEVLMPEKLAAQIQYLQSRTLRSDLAIIVRTLRRIVTGR